MLKLAAVDRCLSTAGKMPESYNDTYFCLVKLFSISFVCTWSSLIRKCLAPLLVRWTGARERSATKKNRTKWKDGKEIRFFARLNIARGNNSRNKKAAAAAAAQ